ncbi:MAG TPA: peptidylprolyl isomerase [Patescibacteria group bacterium]|nr:peptidylprolyl isomerase [Patescibacteria group bacterium]
MTLRARPVARRRGRAGWDSGDRRNSLINAGFFLAIGISILILIGYAAWSWYDDHFGAAATVNGQVVTKDDVRNRARIEGFRLNYVSQRINTLMAMGRITQADGQQQLQFIAQRQNQLASLTVQRLVDNLLMGKLANDDGITVSDEEIDKEITDERTVGEMRHVWMISVEPQVDPNTGEVGDQQKRDAQTKATQALGRLQQGESWEDVARTVDQTGLAPQAGDLGWLQKDSGYDQKFMDAVFAADVNKPTAVIEGDDGTFRIGRYTESAAPQVDDTFDTQLENAGISTADYRQAARGDVVRTKLSDKVVADLQQPGKQRHVLEIYLPENPGSGVGNEPGVKVRWIVFSPNDKTEGAASVPADDPAWTKAKADADAAYAALKADPTRFDAMARSDSDEASAKTTGGKQPWIYATTTIDTAIKNAVLADGLTDGQLLAPVKGAIGWYVIQFMRPEGDGDQAFLTDLKAKLTTDALFEQAAKDNSEGKEARSGGDLGWIMPGQLSDDLDKAILDAEIGKTSDVVTVQSDGNYLLRVLAEETKTPTPGQVKIIKDSGFSYWYTKQKEAATITYPGTSSTTG